MLSRVGLSNRSTRCAHSAQRPSARMVRLSCHDEEARRLQQGNTTVGYAYLSGRLFSKASLILMPQTIVSILKSSMAAPGTLPTQAPLSPVTALGRKRKVRRFLGQYSSVGSLAVREVVYFGSNLVKWSLKQNLTRRPEGYEDRPRKPSCYQSSAGVIQAGLAENRKPCPSPSEVEISSNERVFSISGL